MLNGSRIYVDGKLVSEAYREGDIVKGRNLYQTKQEAIDIMNKGGVISIDGGTYDYYTIINGIFVGYYSASDDKYKVSLDLLEDDNWYLISRGRG